MASKQNIKPGRAQNRRKRDLKEEGKKEEELKDQG